MRDHIHFILNGQPRDVRGREALGLLAPWLRQTPRLTGTKIACAHGACGSCSVLVGHPNAHEKFDYHAYNACILPLWAVDGTHVVTVEGLNGPAHIGGADTGAMSPIQRVLVECHGAQCGFCTPGMAIALTAHCQTQTFDSRAQAQNVLEGNLCRCTGYAPILDAALSIEAADLVGLDEMYPPQMSEISGVEPIEIHAPATDVQGEQTLYSPVTLTGAARWKAAHPDAVVVAGASEIGLKMSVEGWAPREILSLTRVAGLDEVSIEDGALKLGARASWTQVKAVAQDALPEFFALLERWGSPQLRNAGTVAGNVMRAASNGDSLPLFLVMEARLELVGPRGERFVKVADWLQDRESVGADELVTRVELPLPRMGQTLRLHKVTKRRAFDRSIVSAAFLLDARDGIIGEIKIAMGGVAPDAMRLSQTEAFLRGRPLEEATWREAGTIARGEISPMNDAAASAAYRATLASNLIRKFGGEVEK